MMLAEQGAEVVRVSDPRQPPADPVLHAVVGRGKVDATLDLSTPEGRDALRRLAERCDVLVDDLPAGGMLALGIDADALRGGPNPGLVSASIPAFAAGDPRDGGPAHEVAAAVAGCLYEKPLGPPGYHELPVTPVMGGMFAANGIVAALIARLRTGRGQHVGATLFHSTLFAQILQILIKTGVPRGFLPLKMIGTPFMRSWRCKDDRWVYLHITLPAHNARILDLLHAAGHVEDVRDLRATLSAETMRDPSQVKSIAEANRIRTLYTRVFLQRTAEEWEALLGAELCCIKVRRVDEWLVDSVDAGMTDAVVLEDPVFGTMTVPGAGALCEEVPPVLRPRQVDPAAFEALRSRWEAEAPGGGQAPLEPGTTLRHPLEGIRVADLSRIIAGPCSARILAELGAEVTSIMTPTGLDWALSFHLIFNAGKRSVTIDSSDAAGKERLWKVLLDLQPHVLVQNYRHMDVAKAVGVDPASVRARFPSIVYTHLNAYGEQGDWKDRPGFEQVVQAVSGIQLTYGTKGVPKLLPTPIIDIGSGLAGALATQLGLYHRLRTGQTVQASTHLTWMALLFQVRQVAAVQRDKCLAAAASKGAAPAFDPAREEVAVFVRLRDGTACLAGPRGDVEAFRAAAGSLWTRPRAAWQQELQAKGLSGRVALLAVPRAGTLRADTARLDPDPVAAVRARPYPGCPTELTFVKTPIRLSGTPVKDIGPPPERGGSTRQVLAHAGIDVPEGQGTIPYPPNKAFLPWFLDLLRWGWFAWRSGNI
jgi:crotonobetainyl-CoA:carnitine CoA-transferase CaiB-like acyl-CoA transferase